MLKKKTNRQLTLQCKKTIESILRGDEVYIIDTGVKVRVSRLEYNTSYYRKTERKLADLECSIEFSDVATYKALQKCSNYNISNYEPPASLNSKPIPTVSVHANIKLMNLVSLPFESKASKILFGKKK